MPVLPVHIENISYLISQSLRTGFIDLLVRKPVQLNFMRVYYRHKL